MKDRIILAGAAILDVLTRPAERAVFDMGSYAAEDIALAFGGDALNEATVLAALGKKVQLQTILGDDMAGDLIRAHCERNGIALGDDCLRPGMRTGINVVLVQENGERNFLTNKNGSLRKLEVKDLPPQFPADAGIFCFASIFVFLQIGGRELAEIFRAAKTQGMLVCADMTKCKNGETVADIAEALALTDYLLPNEEEACLVTGKKNAEDAAEALLAAGVKHVVIKCGRRGCYLCSEKERGYVAPEESVECVDTTGAGDSFAAGFVYALSESMSFRECARFANRCGASAVQMIGATSWCDKMLPKGEKHAEYH